MVTAKPSIPPPPERWPQPLRDDAERLLRHLAKEAHDGFASLQVTYGAKGVLVDWDQPGAREWLLARLLERIFPAWTGAHWSRLGQPGTQEDAGKLPAQQARNAT